MLSTRPRSVKPNVRWRSARRRSNEKSARAIRREVAGSQRLERGRTAVSEGSEFWEGDVRDDLPDAGGGDASHVCFPAPMVASAPVRQRDGTARRTGEEPLHGALWRSIVADSERGPDMTKPINRVAAAACDAVGDQMIRALGRKPPER